ncbi:MAG TPA: hypothetical protein VG899_15520 [Mycobacteriales bacterium]|jgi:hypothetical protein|nr:hypothetical protein [Mycobacteriales bacterium]HWA67770.1 hypothetical protein [Mycobacteriales bacterium]
MSTGYRLIRIVNDQVLAIDDFATYRAALRARDDDVITVLAETGGYYLVITHWILPAGRNRNEPVTTVVCAVGVDPNRPTPPGPHDLLDTRAWLASAHRDRV